MSVIIYGSVSKMNPNNDFHIGARNGLLEQKHFDQLGSAIWLYLWFIDKQPKDTNKVLGGKPITYQMFAQQFPKIPRITYVRWLAVVENGGYIELLRTPRGYVVTITKPKKWDSKYNTKKSTSSQSDVSKVQHHNKSDVSKTIHHNGSDVSKMIHAEDVSKMIHPIRHNSLDITKDSNTNVLLQPPAEFGDEKINKIISHFEKKIGKMPRQKAQRRAASTLIKRVGFEKVIGGINAVEACRGERFAPNIANIEDLMNKWINLETFYRRLTSSAKRGVKIE